MVWEVGVVSGLGRGFGVLGVIVTILFVCVTFTPCFVSLSFGIVRKASLGCAMRDFFGLIFGFDCVLGFVNTVTVTINIFAGFSGLVATNNVTLF